MLDRSQDVPARREALQALISSDGWHLFVEHVLNEWRGAGYVARMGAALGTKDTTEPQVVHRTAIALLQTLEWPTTQVRSLKGSVGDE